LTEQQDGDVDRMSKNVNGPDAGDDGMTCDTEVEGINMSNWQDGGADRISSNPNEPEADDNG
jgi:hypothetical protein